MKLSTPNFSGQIQGFEHRLSKIPAFNLIIEHFLTEIMAMFNINNYWASIQ